jgi:hypothetical protein
MPQDESFRGGGAAADHVLVAAANVGGDNLENDAVLTLAIPQNQLWEVNAVDFHDAGTHVLYSAVACHPLTLLGLLDWLLDLYVIKNEHMTKLLQPRLMRDLGRTTILESLIVTSFRVSGEASET